MIVMIVCHMDADQAFGGLEKQALMLSRALIEAGREVVVLSSTKRLMRARWGDRDGVPVRLFWSYATPQRGGKHMPAALIWAARLVFWIARNRRQIEAIHVHELRIHAFVAALARKWFAIPTVMKSALGGDKADLKIIGSSRFFGSAGRQFVVSGADAFVATTATIRDDLLKWGARPQQVAVIPNGVCPPPAGSAALASERRSRFLFLGRICDEDKNVFALARAFTMAARGRGLILDFIGQGPDEAALRRLAQASGGAVRALGWLENPQATIGGYGFLLLASHREGLSNSMIEAMSGGLIPVTTRVSGCVDHICPGENGLFFESADEASLRLGVERAAELSHAEWTRMSDAAQDYALRNFGMETIRDRYLSLYASLGTGRAGGVHSKGKFDNARDRSVNRRSVRS